MNSLKRTAIALAATMSFAAGSALAAGDIRVDNNSSRTIHPYFKSNCWNPAFLDSKAGEWVFFGGINARSSFNWNEFHLLLDPACRNPIVKFTCNLGGEETPHQTLVERTVLLQYDALGNTLITLGDEVVVKGVVTTP